MASAFKSAAPEGFGCLDIAQSNKLRVTLLQKCAAEVIGTFILVFGGCGAIAVDAKTEGSVTLLGVALAFGFLVLVLVYAIGHISGCHVNPAVTLAFAAVGRFKWILVPAYLLAQCLGAIFAGLAIRLIVGLHGHLGASFPTGSNGQSLALEAILTFILMFVIMAVATDEHAIPAAGGTALGAVVAGNAIMGGLVSGASMNPARSLGPAIASGFYKGLWVYMVGPVIGAIGGAWAYEVVRLRDPDVAPLMIAHPVNCCVHPATTGSSHGHASQLPCQP